MYITTVRDAIGQIVMTAQRFEFYTAHNQFFQMGDKALLFQDIAANLTCAVA